MKLTIRPIKECELSLLEDFLYEAVFQKQGDAPLPRNVIQKPEIKLYIEDFGKEHDICFIALIDDKPAGAVWTRILSGEMKGYGNIDDKTPEFAISLYPQYRKMGIGTKLMKYMLAELSSRGYEKASLSVQKKNYAAKMYEKLGFRVISEQEDDYLMLHILSLDTSSST